MQFAINNSSAIESLSLQDDTATVTFTGGRSYDYTVADVTSFVSALSEVISSKESVGRFVNQAIRSERLQKVAA